MENQQPSTAAPFQPHPDVVAQRLGEELVLVHLRTNRIYELNTTGARIWELFATGSSDAQLLQRLAEEFELDAERAEEEVRAFRARLSAEQLLRT